MGNPERKLREDQSLHFARRFIEIFRERLFDDPDFQRECTKAALFSPYSLSWLDTHGITFKKDNGVEYVVYLEGESVYDKVNITRYPYSREEDGFSGETVDVNVSYGEEFKSECSLWPGKSGKPRRWFIQFSRSWLVEGEPQFEHYFNDLTAIREIGRFLRENFPAE